jgi:hypothetical protein
MRMLATALLLLLACEQGARPEAMPEAPPVPAPALALSPPAAERIPVEPPEPPRCCICAMEDNRRRHRSRTKEITARYLGTIERHGPRRCSRGKENWATVRFEIVGDYAGWLGAEVTRIRALVTCPDVSRQQALEMSYRDEDSTGGTAPVLRRGVTYRLSIVDEELRVRGHELRPDLVRIDPYETTP